MGFDWISSRGASSTGTGRIKGGEAAMEAAIISVSMACESYHETETFQMTAWKVESFPALNALKSRYTRQTRALGEGITGQYMIPDVLLHASPD